MSNKIEAHLEMKKSVNNTLMWNIFGFISVGIGIVGYIIPLMPGLVFFLIATYCFSRGSKKFLFWLARHRHVGQPIRDFNKKRGITKRNKAILTITVIPGMLFSALIVVNEMWLKITISATAILVLIIIWVFKTKK